MEGVLRPSRSMLYTKCGLGSSDFLVRVAAGMKAKGHEKSADECKQCWEVAVEKTKERGSGRRREEIGQFGWC